MFDKIFDFLFSAFITALVTTFVWALWPHAVYAFPRLVGEGWIEPKLDWWTAACIVALFDIFTRKR